MATKPVWDGTNHNLMDIDEDLGLYHGYEPWKTIIQGIKTATAYIKPFQQPSRQVKINRDNIAEALAKKIHCVKRGLYSYPPIENLLR